MTAQKKRGLGRGLDAIFGTTNPTQQSTPMSEMAEVAIADIEPNPLQPRSEFDEDALAELSESISQLGVIQPITLKRRADGRRKCNCRFEKRKCCFSVVIFEKISCLIC